MKYRKIPLEVEAFQMRPDAFDNMADWPQWLQDASRKPNGQEGSLCAVNGVWLLMTRNGCCTLSDYEWIIKGVEDELYPCADSIFKATYERSDGSMYISLPAGSITAEQIEDIKNMGKEPFQIVAQSDLDADYKNFDFFRKITFASIQTLGLNQHHFMSLTAADAVEEIKERLTKIMDNSSKRDGRGRTGTAWE